MSITRRVFLRNGAMAVVGTAAVPHFLTRAAFGAVIKALVAEILRRLPSAQGPEPASES